MKCPCENFTDAARRIGKGDFSQPVEIDNQDELDVLAQTINQMAADLSELYGSLEARVAKKTKGTGNQRQLIELSLSHRTRCQRPHRKAIDFDFWVKELSRVTGIEGMGCASKPQKPSSLISTCVATRWHP